MATGQMPFGAALLMVWRAQKNEISGLIDLMVIKSLDNHRHNSMVF